MHTRNERQTFLPIFGVRCGGLTNLKDTITNHQHLFHDILCMCNVGNELLDVDTT